MLAVLKILNYTGKRKVTTKVQQNAKDQAPNQLDQGCADRRDEVETYRTRMIQQGETKEGTRDGLAQQRRERPMSYQESVHTTTHRSHITNDLEKKKLMDELLPKDQENYKPMSDYAKMVITNLDNMEFFEIVKQTLKTRCTHCLQHVAAGHVHCQCRTSLLWHKAIHKSTNRWDD